jgi:glycosyltransferase involved in cell wall biosynthesis
MKYLLSVPLFFPYGYGGGQVYVYRLARELLRRGHDVNIISSAPWQSGNEEYAIESYEYSGVPVRTIKLNPKALSAGDIYSELSPVLMQGLKALLNQLNPDLVHINGLKAAMITICNRLNIPHVVTAHHPGFVCPAGDLLTPNENLCQKSANRTVCIRCCCIRKTSNNMLGCLLGQLPRQLYRPIGETFNRYKRIPYVVRGLMYPWLIEKRIEGQTIRLNDSNFIISPSEAMRNLLIGNGVDPEKIFLMPHGIEPIARLPFDKINSRQIGFGYVGSFNRAKGFHILLQALEQISSQDHCELHIFGGAQNPWGNKFVADCMAGYSGRAKIINHGYISHDELQNAFKEIDILVVPSIYLEVFGLVILEGFSAGRPVIVSKSGGPAELVRDGVDGFVVERNDSKALAMAMQKFIDNPDLITQMSSRILPVKTIQQYVDEVERVYRHLISAHN